jgi:hypothetical protein
MLLLHRVSRDRKPWKGVAVQLAAAEINALTLDMCGIGESGGTRWEKLSFRPHQRSRNPVPRSKT